MLKIGDLELENPLILAPMAGITNLPFRLLARRYGAAMAMTEMVSSFGLVRRRPRTLKYLISRPEESPLGVQMFGQDPGVMADAASMAVDFGADLVDINMGCPAKKVVKTGAGGALLRDLEKAARVIHATRKAVSAPLTVKLRAGWSEADCIAPRAARLAQDLGADAVTIHGRYVSQGFSGRADWNVILEAKKTVTIPVIGNGDVFSATDAVSMLQATGCDGVMIARGAIGNPWIFAQVLRLLHGLPAKAPSLAERKSVAAEHAQLLCGLEGEVRAAKKMRGLLLWYTKGLPYSTQFREGISRIIDEETLLSSLDEFFSLLEKGEHES